MIRHYLKSAFRNLLRDKFYSIINVAGLGIGIAISLLIFSYVRFERSFDGFHSKSDQIYRVTQSARLLDKDFKYGGTGHGLAAALKKDFPEIAHTARLEFINDEVEISYKEKKIIKKKGDVNLVLADNDIFKIFDIELIQGNPKTALLDPNSIILTEEESRKYFNDENPIGKFIDIHYVENGYYDNLTLKVTGVAKALPANSHFEFKYLISQDKNPRLFVWPYIVPLVVTYVTLPEDYPVKNSESKFPDFVKTYLAPEIEKKYAVTYDDWLESGGYWKLKFQPLNNIHLNKDDYSEIPMIKKGDLFHVQIYSIIAFSIIALACINFITLSTARSGTRAKEVGVRKVNGANRRQLIWQFLTESIILSIFALMLAIILIITFAKPSHFSIEY